MKKQLVTMLLSGIALVTAAQSETDDLYYSFKDRKADLAVRPKTVQHLSDEDGESFTNQREFNGQYAGRNENPDFNPAMASADVQGYDYFQASYAPMAVNSGLYNNHRFNSFGNNFYNPYYDPYRFNSFNNPWGFYDPFDPYGWNNGFGWGSSGYRSFYRSGCMACWSMGSSFGWGNNWYGMNSFGVVNNFYGFGGWNNPHGYYPGSVVIINNDYRPKFSYGRRPNRSSSLNNDAQNPVRRNNIIVNGTNSRSSSSNGRSSASETTSYYQRGWRQDPSINPRPSQPLSPSSGSYNRGNGWNNLNGSGSEWRESRSRSFESPSNNSGRSSGGFGSGFSSGGSSSGGRRGRD